MKKFTLIAALFVSLISLNSAQAQSFTIDKDTTRGAFSPLGSGVVEPKVLIATTSKTAIQVDWRISHFSKDPGWAYESTCDNSLCYYDPSLIDGTTKTTSALFNIDSPAFYLKVAFDGNAAANGSKSMATIDLSVGGGPIQKVTFIATKGTSGIVTTVKSDEEISIFPNPASNYIDVKYSSASDVKTIAIYNLIGKVVNVFKVTDKNSAHCEFNADMPSGIYIVRISDSKGNIIATRKITHQ